MASLSLSLSLSWLRGQVFLQAGLHLLTAVYEAMTHRVYGKSFPLRFDSQYWETLGTLSAVCGPQPDPWPPCHSQGLSFVSLPANASYAAVVAALPNSVHNLRHLYPGRRDPASCTLALPSDGADTLSSPLGGDYNGHQ